MNDARSPQPRRSSDRLIEKLIETIQQQTHRIDAMQADIAQMAEVMEAWRGAKRTIRFVFISGQILKWFAAVIGAFVVVWYTLWEKK